MRAVPRRAAAAVAALLALGGTAAVGTYIAVREEPEPAPTTTTTSTTLSPVALAEALAGALSDGLRVAVSPEEARCLAGALVATIPPAQLEDLAPDDPLTDLSEAQRADLVRATVDCVPTATAEALLGDASTTTIQVDLPDEGG